MSESHIKGEWHTTNTSQNETTDEVEINVLVIQILCQVAALTTDSAIVIIEQFKVCPVQLSHAIQFSRTNLTDKIGSYLCRLLLPSIVRIRVRKLDAFFDAEPAQDEQRVFDERFVMSNEVVADVTRMTEIILQTPVVV